MLIEDNIDLPSWVSVPVSSLLFKYLNEQNIKIYHEHLQNTPLLIQTLRLTDYFVMTKFHDRFIT